MEEEDLRWNDARVKQRNIFLRKEYEKKKEETSFREKKRKTIFPLLHKELTSRCRFDNFNSFDEFAKGENKIEKFLQSKAISDRRPTTEKKEVIVNQA